MSSKTARKKNKKNLVSPELKSWFGFIPPIVYAPVLFTAAVLWLAFALFIAPGKKHYGSFIQVGTTPPGALVYAGEKLIGSTPLEAFVPAGDHILRLEKPFFKTKEIPIRVGGRLFFSLFFPKRQKLSADLELQEQKKWLNQAYYEADSWYAFPYDRVHGRPPVVKETTEALIALWEHLQDKETALQWAASLRDLVRDEESWNEVNESWKALIREEISLPEILNPFLKAESFEDFLNIARQITAPEEKSAVRVLRSGGLHIADLNFIPINAGEIRMERFNGEAEVIKVNAFYYMPGYLSAEDFTRLTSEMSDGTNLPVVGISADKAFQAVEAVNQILKEQGITNLRASLPTEAQWQYLAAEERIQAELFEWTADNYLPYRSLFYRGENFPQPFSTREKVIRGKSVFSGPAFLQKRFGYPRELDSPYISMRLVLVPEP